MDTAALVARPSRLPGPSRRLALAGSVAAAVGAMAVTASVAASGAADHAFLVAVARAVMVGTPIAVGLYAWYGGSEERFGLLLVAVGAGWFLTTLAESDDQVLYTLGRAAGWLVEVLLVYVILSFPTGRLPARIDRVLVGATGLVVLTLFLPRLLLAQSFEVPSPYTSCAHECPPNAFFPFDHQPALVAGVMRPVGSLLVVALAIAVVLRLEQRFRASTPLARRMFVPVLAVAAARTSLLGVAFVARHEAGTARPVQVLAWLIALAVPLLALAFLAGLLRWRLFAGQALERLAGRLHAMPVATALGRTFAEAFGDPSVQVAFPRSGRAGWTDSWGEPLALPAPGEGRSVSEVREGGDVVAAVIHDEALEVDRKLLDAGLAMAGLALGHERLAAEARAATDEVRRSRARIAASAERERRRIERDLHDGAQQRLVALRIELELAEDLVRRDPEGGISRLQELEHEVDEALEDLRSLAHGVYPPLLADRGLAEALRAVAARASVPVAVEADGVGRYAAEVESAVYFCVLEALQNVLKHADGARHVDVRLDAHGNAELRFSVRDDGAGAPDGSIRTGAGLTNMRDRLAAVGGDVQLHSRPGMGTNVRGRVPALPEA